MGRNYLEVLFRHKVLLALPVIVCFVLAAGASYALVPRAYMAGAIVWTDNPIPLESTAGTTEGPSEGRATLLNQLLSTREFGRSVLEVSPLAEEYRELDRLSGDYLIAEVVGSVMVATAGPQLLSVNVKWDDPDEALGIVQAVIQQFEERQRQVGEPRAQALVDYNAEQVKLAQRTLTEAPSDSAQQQYTEAVSAYNESVAALERLTLGAMQVIDAPEIAYPQARMKTIVMGAAGGLLAGLTLSLLTLVLLMARDRTVRGADEARSLGLNVVAVIPAYASRSSSRLKLRRRESSGPVGAGR